MHAFRLQTDPAIPEHPEITFETNGFQGGDSGNGGFAQLSLSLGGSLGFEVSTFRDPTMGDEGGIYGVTIRTTGDWETDGFVQALLSLGRQLAEREDVLESERQWAEAHEENDKLERSHDQAQG